MNISHKVAVQVLDIQKSSRCALINHSWLRSYLLVFSVTLQLVVREGNSVSGRVQSSLGIMNSKDF